jgi:hypothetical protein
MVSIDDGHTIDAKTSTLNKFTPIKKSTLLLLSFVNGRLKWQNPEVPFISLLCVIQNHLNYQPLHFCQSIYLLVLRGGVLSMVFSSHHFN